jgi:hypothetical protein
VNVQAADTLDFKAFPLVVEEHFGGHRLPVSRWGRLPDKKETMCCYRNHFQELGGWLLTTSKPEFIFSSSGQWLLRVDGSISGDDLCRWLRDYEPALAMCGSGRDIILWRDV